MTQELVECYLDAEDYSAEECWRLVEWCRSHGASEFGVTAIPDYSSMCLQDEVVYGPAFTLWGKLQPENIGVEERETFAHTPDEFLHVDTKRLAWLSDATVAVLHKEYRHGLFAAYGRDGEDRFIEDPILYRNGQLMLAISTGEGRGLLRVTQHERFMLQSSKFVLRPDWWG